MGWGDGCPAMQNNPMHSRFTSELTVQHNCAAGERIGAKRLRLGTSHKCRSFGRKIGTGDHAALTAVTDILPIW